MLDLLLRFVPFFSLVLIGWAAARRGVVPTSGIPALNAFVLYFALSAMVFRLSASGALMPSGLWGLLLAYGLGGVLIVVVALVWSARMRLSRRDGGLLALVTAFPNTGFLGLPLLTGLLGPEAAGTVAATLIVDVLLLSSVCLAWAHSHGTRDPARDDPREAWHAAQASLKGALRNPLLWSMAAGMAFAWAGLRLPAPVDETVRLLGLSATPCALFTLGAMLARSQMNAGGASARPAVIAPAALKLCAHPLLVYLIGKGLQEAGMPLSHEGLMTLTLAAALPSASNVSMLAEREGADTAPIARMILLTTAVAFFSVGLWAAVLGVQAQGR